MASNWGASYASFSSNSTNIGQPTLDNITMDDLFNIKKDENVEKLIQMKENTVNLIQKKDEINLIPDDDDYKNEEIDTLVEDIMKKIEIFNTKQIEMDEITNDFQEELGNIKEKISTIENMIDFVKKLPQDYKEDEESNKIVENMHQLSKKIISNEKITELKKKYITKYKELYKYIYLIRKINQFNSCNMCPLCFSNQVDHFLNPCGHTFCKECIQRVFKKDDSNIYEVGRNSHAHCPVCRDTIQKINQLYFL